MATRARTVRQLSEQVEQCIDNCWQCHRLCLETVTHCLDSGGQHADAGHIRLLLDCAEICQTSANFMIRSSQLHATVCSSCAEVCRRCAEACEQFGNDALMKACAEACRRCVESCQLMVANAIETGKE